MKSWKVHYLSVSKAPSQMSCCLDRWKYISAFLLLIGLGLYMTYSAFSQLLMPAKSGLRLVQSVTVNPDLNNSRWQRRLPNALIIGSAKSGTRALLVSLKIHPDVRMYPKELHFFNQDQNYAQGLEWYQKQMPLSLPGEITMEKTPGYFTSPKTPKRVHAMNKDVRLLLIVRDPTIRAISAFTQLREHNTDMPSFEKYVTKDSQDVLNTEITVIQDGVYIKHLLRWLNYFPLSQFHFISGENFTRDPAAVMKSTERFLGLRPFITERNFYFNKTKGFQCFIGKIKFDGKRTTGCLNKSKGRKHPQVRERVVKMLQNYYRPYNQKFSELVGQNFSWH